MYDLATFAPLPEVLLVVPLATAALCRVLPGRATAGRVGLVGSGATLAMALLVASQVAYPGATPTRGVSGWFYVDALSSYLVAVVALVAFIAAWYSLGYLRTEWEHGAILPDDPRRYHGWFHLFVATMAAACILDNLGLVWAAIEATTLASALLVGFYRHEAALEAAWKYLILCSAGITLALAGIILVFYAATQALGSDGATLDWSALAPVASRLDPRLMGLAFILVLVGYGTKAGLAPMHTWLPDAHSQAPTPISAVLSGVLLNCALYGLLRVHALAAAASAAAATAGNRSFDLLVLAGVLSVAVAVPFVLVQHDLKRLLAYSSVEHTGLVALAAGLGTPLALYGALLHVLTHAVTKTLLFCTSGMIIQRYGTRRIARIRGAAQAVPVAGILFLLGSLAIGGAPPFAPFVSELAILAGAFGGRAYLVAVVLLACLGAVFAGLLFHATRVVLGAAPKRLRDPMERPAPARDAWPLVAAFALVVVLGVWVPEPVRDAAAAAATILPVRSATGGAR